MHNPIHDRLRLVVTGNELLCDISADILANAEISSAVGLPVERAIAVNDRMLTGDPDIYAVGECAQQCGTNYSLAGEIENHSDVLQKLPSSDVSPRHRSELLSGAAAAHEMSLADLFDRFFYE